MQLRAACVLQAQRGRLHCQVVTALATQTSALLRCQSQALQVLLLTDHHSMLLLHGRVLLGRAHSSVLEQSESVDPAEKSFSKVATCRAPGLIQTTRYERMIRAGCVSLSASLLWLHCIQPVDTIQFLCDMKSLTESIGCTAGALRLTAVCHANAGLCYLYKLKVIESKVGPCCFRL
jgi:hypothetical protein